MSSDEAPRRPLVRTYGYIDPATGVVVRVRCCVPGCEAEAVEPGVVIVEAPEGEAVVLGSHRGERQPDGSWRLVPNPAPLATLGGLPFNLV